MWSRSLSTADHPALSTHYNMSCLFPVLIPLLDYHMRLTLVYEAALIEATN